ncbi:tRNA (adenosine(37)-N6)-threonylcarbamoyltransferase complex dimerization subunit type 1 TsaB [Tabrizicola oligotrophica]|uniref:tRNA (Adenosine(37)-N6)-threonylcarbamoyltransferase complex dimerization subunit type 1 TsaB n=1 Tax=Tabrizicola oligotrophica TaxID=2710650 RepID=A0A6M0QQQ8_9RHOB|nr:tRNA (adenosine(37)-N6)-threonylcarbamoyltransferase complex dimerization subunit type 1 TsaB [Tabrizicola oligotrophica]NEY89829.1 tRNA (adenosine(37)-N6)-threonylcarbamoyltransferase complex dimerization subunit type 1 TsaB [Tabrizicola oligotrophica]
MRPETVLAFDTSAAHCAAALLLPDGRVLNRLEAMDKGQAERLMPLLQEMLDEAGIGFGDLTRIAVGTGPGNFTGVRISVAAARGLALALGVPALGVTRLEALAHGLPRPLTVIEDARRGAVYLQVFGPDATDACLLDAVQVPATARTPHLTGDAAGPAALPPALPLAQAIAEIAAARSLPQPRPAPFYLRGADAAPPSDPPPVLLPG